MEAENVEMKPEGGSSQPVEIPQSVSTHSVGGWPKVNLKQSANYDSDLRPKQVSVAGNDLVFWEEVGERVWEPSFFDQYSDPDKLIDTIFNSIDKIAILMNDPKKMYMERRGKSYKLSHFDLDRFTPPSQTAPTWKQRNYEQLLDKLVEYTTRVEDVNVIPESRDSIRDWGGPLAAPYLASFLNDRIREADDPHYDSGDYTSGLGLERLSKSTLGNRFDTALVLDTPRKTMAAWNFFSLVHAGFPWFKRMPQLDGLWNNFRVPLYVRSYYEVFNSYVSKIPNYQVSLKLATESISDMMIGGISENLTYDPPMYDIGGSILNIGISVSNHVNAMIRSHVKMESVSYMETSSLLMQMSNLSTNRASSMSAFTATLNNAAASAAFEPVLNALACEFTKISLDLPTNARQATVMMVVALMTYPSCIYDNQTRCLIHNMFVGMVMPTSAGLNIHGPATESTIDFSTIRKLSSEHKLMPTPPIPMDAGPAGRNGSYKNSQKVRDAMIRLLCHYHGLDVGTRVEPSPASINNALWKQGDGDNNRAGYAYNPVVPEAPDTYSDSYLKWWGDIPKPHITTNSYLSGVMPTNVGVTVGPTIVASTFDYFPVDTEEKIDEPVRKSIEEADYRDFGAAGSDTRVGDTTALKDARAHGIPVRVLGRVNRDGRWYALCKITDLKFKASFTDEVMPVMDSVIDVSDRNNIKIYEDPELAPGVTSPISDGYLFPEGDVTHISNVNNPATKIRPRLRSILPVRGMSDEDGTMSEDLKKFISNVIQPILTSVSVIGENKYVDNLGMLMFNQRWAQFMDYISESATVTMLCDYSPFGYAPLLVCAGEGIDARDPYLHRNHSNDNHVMTFRPAGPNSAACITLFDAPMDEDGNPGITLLNRGYWRYEPEPNHRSILLEPSSILALSLLGVAPATPPDISGSLALNLDSKAFNHDVSIMKTSARLFVDTYNPDVFAVLGRFDALSPVYKLQKFRNILTKMRAMFPVVSTLTDQLDKSLDTFDLRQNHFWRASPYIDADFPPAMSALVNPLDSYQLPFLKHRPIVPMVSTNTRNCGSYGYQDTLFSQIHDSIRQYYEHKLSRIDRITTLALLPDSRVDNKVARTRTYRQGALPLPMGVPYISPQYMDTNLLDCRWLYDAESAGALAEYDMYEAMLGKYDVVGVTPSRPHSMVYSDWLYKRRMEAGKVLLPHIVVNKHGMKLQWGETSDLKGMSMAVPTPDIVDYKFPDLSVTALYTTPSAYVSKQQDIMDSSGVPSGVIPVLEKNQGPFISRLEVRGASWPASADYTEEGALTENIMSNAPEGAGGKSCEYNIEMIGIVPSRINPLNLIDPSSMLVMVKDPIATWHRI